MSNEGRFCIDDAKVDIERIQLKMNKKVSGFVGFMHLC